MAEWLDVSSEDIYHFPMRDILPTGLNKRCLSINGLANDLILGRTTIYNCLRRTWNPSLITLVYLVEQMSIPLGELIAL